MESNTPPNTPPKTIGNYEVIATIGRGGMGIVYKARQTGLDRIVALKMILEGQCATADDVTRFKNEARAAASLDHPGIVGVHEIGEHQGLPYFTMDYVSGQTLANVLQHSPLPSNQAAELSVQIADAVAHAHASGVLHRDLKPANILLDADDNPRVADFGLAKHVNDTQDLTQTGQPLGTPSYMSPEQAGGRRRDVGPATDVYGLGAVLYAMLTGLPPVRPANQADALRSVAEDLPISPRKLNPSVDRDLESICLRCLEKRHEERYGSAADLRDDLRRYLEGQPITARPRSQIRQLINWSRRPQRSAQAAAIVLLIAAFYGLCSAVGFFLISQLELDNPDEATLIIGLDGLGFAVCLPIGWGMLYRKAWAAHVGLLAGIVMIGTVVVLILTGSDAGGLLADVFRQVAIFSIFGFVGLTMTAASLIAIVSDRAFRRQDRCSSRGPSRESTQPSDPFKTTIDSSGVDY